MWESVGAFTEARNFAGLYSIEGTVLVDEQGVFAAACGLRGVPANVLVGADGVVTEMGASTPEQLHRAVSELLGHSDW